MLSLFKRKQITLDAMGAAIVASAHTHGHAGGSMHEVTVWVYQRF
jgi:hypothetical protein